MANPRTELLLVLLEALGGRVGETDFQKLLFLHCMERGESSPYEFIPYRFGAFSFTCYADRRKLVEAGALESGDRWALTEEGRRLATAASPRSPGVREFAERHSKLRGDALVARTYRDHPYFATRSEIAARVLAGDSSALEAIAHARPAAGAALATIGYEGRSLENYLNALYRAGVTLLCDVRRNPLSRKYGFSKSTLSKGCEGIGIRYEHLPQLGIDSEERRDLVTRADRDALFERYRRETLPLQTEALTRIRGWIAGGESVALTCFERLPFECHRHCVADSLLRGMKQGSLVSHL